MSSFSRPSRTPAWLRQVALLGGSAWLGACGGTPTPAAAPAPPRAAAEAPASVTVLALVRHYADLTAQAAVLATPASRAYGPYPAQPQTTPASYEVFLPAYLVTVDLDPQQRIEYVSLGKDEPAPLLTPSPRSIPDRPAVGRLLPLGELRRLYGPGKPTPGPLTLAQLYRRYHIVFLYQPQPSRPAVLIEALMPTASYADSSTVYSIWIHPDTRLP